MGRRDSKSDVKDPALFCEFHEACLAALQLVIDEGLPATTLRDIIDKYAKNPNLPPSALESANELVKEVVERRLEEAVVHVSTTGAKHSGTKEMLVLEHAISDQIAARGVRPELVENARVVYANLEARLLNQSRAGLMSEWGPLSPKSAAKSFSEFGDLSRAKISAEVESLLSYLTDKRLTSDAKATACFALLKIVQADPVVSYHLIPRLTKTLPITMKDKDEDLQMRAHSIFIELLLGQSAVSACCRCLKTLAERRPALWSCRNKLSRNEQMAARTFRDVLVQYLGIVREMFDRQIHTGVLAAVTGLERMARVASTIARKLSLSHFPKLLAQMKEVYLDQPPHKTDKKYAPTIALRVKQLMHHLRMAEVQLTDAWADTDSRGRGRPDVMARTLTVWRRRAEPMPFPKLVKNYNTSSATYPH